MCWRRTPSSLAAENVYNAKVVKLGLVYFSCNCGRGAAGQSSNLTLSSTNICFFVVLSKESQPCPGRCSSNLQESATMSSVGCQQCQKQSGKANENEPGIEKKDN